MSNIKILSCYQTKETIIDGITIRQDAEGRYCLNDVQRAATLGRNPRTVELHEFMRRPETIKLVELLENTGNPHVKAYITKRGRTGGTYAVKELIYAYAMWISPSYHLKVIRAYGRMVTDGVAVHESVAQDLLTNPLKHLQAIIGQAQALVEENARLKQKSETDVPKVNNTTQ
ncbi:KilA-N domain-containing protein [Pseudomonas sp. GM25]|uniref:KilA-N domain-containing protein n=1 Tax=Pseudomonas sp. GM25 TaxID=1144327 RepID=UPI0002704FD2|nr:KilA-N domain-containing protein [Pseudomonas sp. GM25]EJM25761.1 KilA-N domain-containing protein [Pseudomonas sp. GM25]